MNAKEKAEEMYDKMLNSDIMNMTKYCAKQCCLIAVDEVLYAITFNMYDEEAYNKVDDFWENVKLELQRL
jgi:hypothetical protein